MTTCFDAGALRAYLDGELPEEEAGAVAAHLDECEQCRARLSELSALDDRVERAMASASATTAAEPAADAFERLRSRLPQTPARHVGPARMPRLAHAVHGRRSAVGGAVAAALLLVVLLVPGARAAAGSLLQVFRAQSVVYVSVSPNRVQQLQNLNVDANALFISKPKQIGAEPSIQHADSPAAAASLAGFAPGALTSFPSAPTTTNYAVMGPSAYQLQVNVKTLRSVLSELGVTDVTIPDALGEKPITVSLSALVEATYSGNGYTATLIQGTSPTVDLPNGVDLSQLGKAALEVYGMSPDQAGALSKQIDWRSTLVFPFPTGTSQIQQVKVNGADGVLLDSGGGDLFGSSASSSSASSSNQSSDGGRTQGYVVYWQKGDHFYVLQVKGTRIGETAVLTMADSLR